jgi:alkylated DNA repair protein (DNA oxidative demethylase)
LQHHDMISSRTPLAADPMLDLPDTRPTHERIADGAYLLRGFALDNATTLLTEIEQIETAAAFRHLETPGGFRMSVAMTNCGSLGWVSDRRGYRYTTHDPLSGQPWPAMPSVFCACRESGTNRRFRRL